MAILVGLLTAFAVQFLLTNLGLALGISLLKYRPQTSSKQATDSSQSESSKISVNISFFAGLGILLTLNSVLFIACFLAVRFSTASDTISGATLGLVIWSTYFLILLWVSYNSVGSLMSWVFGSVATKLGQLIEAISTSIQGKEKPVSEILTEETAAQLIQQEIRTALAEFDLQQRIEDYLKTIPQPQLDLTAITQGFADLLENLDLDFFAETNLLQKIDRQTFINLIDERTNLSTSESEKVVDRLLSMWQQTIDRYREKDLNEELLHWLQSANPEELQFEQLIERLEQLVGKDFEHTSADLALQSEQNEAITVEEESLPGVFPSLDRLRKIISSSTLDWKAIKNTLLNRVDLSEVDIEDIWYTLQSLYHKINSSEASPKLPFNTIRNDVEDYLWHASRWYLNCEKGWQEFKQIIYDPQADLVQVRFQLEQIQPEDLVELLQQRDDLESEEIDEIAEHLAAVRQEIFDSIELAEGQEQKQQLTDRLKNYLQTVDRAELQGNNLARKMEQLLIKSGVSLEILTQFLPTWQQLDWQTWLKQRQDLELEELQQIVERLEAMGDHLLTRIEDWQVQITSKQRELQAKLESYLRYTHLKYLTRENIDAKLEELWQKVVDNYLPEIQQRLPEIDRSALVEILEKRKGLNVERVEEIAEQIATKLSELNSSVTQEISQLQVQATELSEELLDYLERASEKNLNLAEIEAELPQLLNLAKRKTTTVINQQLAQLNWDEIEQKLKQVEKYSEIQIRQSIKQVRKASSKLIKLPRRWATRTSQQVRELMDELEDFLSYSNKIEFSSERIERNLQRIFHQSPTWSHSLSNSAANNLDRLAQLTPAKITKSLSSRQDLTPVEVEQISDRFMAITHQLSEEIKTKQHQTNQLVQQLIDRISEYLSSLNLWHLDYDKVKASLASFDFPSLTHSWQEMLEEIPLEELGDRLGKLSYESLLTIMKDNELDSILPQIQGVSDYLSEQIETIKLAAYERIETIKQEILQQVEATRKAIAFAAYWMCAITFTSAISSAMAGFLATRVDF
ncbi:MAG: hypothetical protein QNJ34_18160 [Xenococcaceae cyanobacterium MO_188.B29]|nr:hypothetical protein [Xenococcaceae cyanobacterium MO_188.B29]